MAKVNSINRNRDPKHYTYNTLPNYVQTPLEAERLNAPKQPFSIIGMFIQPANCDPVHRGRMPFNNIKYHFICHVIRKC